MIFFRILGNVTNAIVNIDDFKIHENKDGSVDKTKTDLYLHLVNYQNNSIMEVPDVLRLVDQNIELLDTLFKVDYCILRKELDHKLMNISLGFQRFGHSTGGNNWGKFDQPRRATGNVSRWVDYFPRPSSCGFSSSLSCSKNSISTTVKSSYRYCFW